jgi:hypothetical protein
MNIKQPVVVVSIILLGTSGAMATQPAAKTHQAIANNRQALAENTYNPESRTIQGGNENQLFTVKLSKSPFQTAGREITQKADGFYLINGRRPLGIASMRLPQTELSSFDVQVDGKRWTVPAQLWNDCYEPNLGKVAGDATHPEISYLQAWLSKDGQRLTVKMLGSDGAGAYTVTWNLRSDGNHSREIKATN